MSLAGSPGATSRGEEAAPLVLLIDAEERTSRLIEGTLRPKGYRVLVAPTAQRALDLVREVRPEVVVVDFRLPDRDGVDVLRELRAAPTIGRVTPILMLASTRVGKAERLEAFGGGAWAVLHHPVDPAELVLRVDALSAAKREADTMRAQGLRDPDTGFYNVRGLLERARESTADAARFQRPIACVAFGPHAPDWPSREESPEAESTMRRLTADLAGALATITRVSDAVGSLGSGHFVVVAPGTPQEGALRLIDRVLESFRQTLSHDGGDVGEGLEVRAGFYVPKESETTAAQDLLLRATAALRRAQAHEGSFPVRSYDA